MNLVALMMIHLHFEIKEVSMKMTKLLKYMIVSGIVLMKSLQKMYVQMKVWSRKVLLQMNLIFTLHLFA